MIRSCFALQQIVRRVRSRFSGAPAPAVSRKPRTAAVVPTPAKAKAKVESPAPPAKPQLHEATAAAADLDDLQLPGVLIGDQLADDRTTVDMNFAGGTLANGGAWTVRWFAGGFSLPGRPWSEFRIVLLATAQVPF